MRAGRCRPITAPRRRVALAFAALCLATPGPAAADVSGPVAVSSTSPFAANCNGFPQSGTEYRSAEVEPFVAADPTDSSALAAAWQQDRWSNGGSNGVLTATSTNGGSSWSAAASPPFSRCAGGTVANGGDYERATDPWISFGPDGKAYQVALAFDNGQDTTNAILVATSTDGGATWGPIATLIRDTASGVANDKESVTADRGVRGAAYVVWDRLIGLTGSFTGPTYFSRTLDGGQSWSRARAIVSPGSNGQTIGNQVVVAAGGKLVNGFDLINAKGDQLAVVRSGDRGKTWSKPRVVSQIRSIGVYDPRDSAPVRTAGTIPDLAADPRKGKLLYAVWQDARFSAGNLDQVVLSRSSDGGKSWSSPQRISQNTATQAFTPAIEVDKGGNVGVTYYDFTNDSKSGSSLDTDLWFARSTDGGRHFGARERVTPSSFDMRQAPNADGFFVGDYQGLAAQGSDYEPLFARTSSSSADPTSVFAARAHSPFSSRVVRPHVPAGARVPKSHPRRSPRRPRGPVRRP